MMHLLLVISALSLTGVISLYATEQSNAESFWQAAREGNLEKLQEYIENGGNIDMSDSNGRTALLIACRLIDPSHQQKYYDCITYLLQKNADPNLTDSHSRQTALAYADSASLRIILDADTARPRLTAYSLFLYLRNDIRFIHDFGIPSFTIVLNHAVSRGLIKDILTMRGSRDQLTLLEAAFYEEKDKDFAFFRALKSAGADINSTDENGYTILDNALEKTLLDEAKMKRVCDALKSCGAKLSEKKEREITEQEYQERKSKEATDRLNTNLSKATSVSDVEYLLKQGANPNTPKYMEMLLIRTGSWDDRDFIKIAIALIQSKTLTDENKQKWLTYAVEKSNIDIVQALLDANTDQNCCFAPYSKSLLECAFDNENTDIIKMLLSAQSKPKKEDIQSVFKLAESYSKLEIVKIFIDGSYILPSSPPNTGQTIDTHVLKPVPRPAQPSTKSTNIDQAKLFCYGGFTGTVLSVAAMLTVHKKYNVTLRELFSRLPTANEFESYNEFKEKIGNIKKARTWLASLGILGAMSTVVGVYGYQG